MSDRVISIRRLFVTFHQDSSLIYIDQFNYRWHCPLYKHRQVFCVRSSSSFAICIEEEEEEQDDEYKEKEEEEARKINRLSN